MASKPSPNLTATASRSSNPGGTIQDGQPAAPPFQPPDAYTLPISSRPPTSKHLQSLIFLVLFDGFIILTHLFQLVAFPLSLHPTTRPYFEAAIDYSKLAFARALLVVNQFFGPTRLVLSIGDGQGGYLDTDAFVVRDKQTGAVHRLELPGRSVWMSNHQVYTDWLYLWCLAYYADLADAILIILKHSLKWIPFVGWGMQFYRFIFLKRNWAADQKTLERQLRGVAKNGHQARRSGTNAAENGGADGKRQREMAKNLLLLIFPEGTLVSSDTRPKSKAYAEKLGIEDMENLLLPRSTGLLFCLRSLAREMDDLWLVDFTIGYPGIPPAGYGQSYYTLRSVFMQGVSPPAVHLHLTLTRITPPSPLPSRSQNPSCITNVPTAAHDVPPLGDLSQLDATDPEKAQFDQWLRDRWLHKDEEMRRFYRDGDFVGGAFARAVKGETDGERIDRMRGEGGRFVVVPARLRRLREVGDAACWGVGGVGVWVVGKVVARVWSWIG